MPKPILYYATYNPPVRSVLLTAKAIDLELEMRFIDLFKTDDLNGNNKKKNPQHTIPTLEDDGTIIWDSHAICTYLIGKYAKSDDLYPTDLRTKSKVDQRLHFDSGILSARLQLTYEPIYLNASSKIVERCKNIILEAYDFLEYFLKDNLFLVGNTLTVADLCCISTISTICQSVPIAENKYPKITTWMERIARLPYFKESDQDDFVEIFINNMEIYEHNSREKLDVEI